MKILKLRFQNLNSLVGEWEIDFTHSAYIDDGIFAITGATGAGKSTILDAICLALYGATPRLGDITKGKNDLMSRQTFECFSEVIFNVQGKSYICHWSQRKAKKTGTLQSPKHEIAEYIDGTNDKLIEEKASRTKVQVEEITGMDFHRFTRAMLLAQGSFSAFLQASSDERSPILEQITGTEIYTEISKKVHEFKTQSENDLKSDKEKLSVMNVLSEEEEQTLIDRKNQLTQSLAKLKSDIENTEKDKIWRNNLGYYRNEVTKLTGNSNEIKEKVSQFSPQKNRLDRALKALQIRSDVAQLRTLRQNLTQQTSELTHYKQQLPTATHHAANTKLELEKNHTTYNTTEQALQTAQSLFKQVRELDSQLHQQQQLWQETQQKSIKLNQLLATNQQALTKSQQQLTDSQIEKNQYIAEQQQIPNPDKLVEHITQLENLQENIVRRQQEQQNLQQHHHKLQQAKSAAEQDSENLSKTIDTLYQKHQQSKIDNKTIEQRLETLFAGQKITELRQHGEQLWHIQKQTETLHQHIDDWRNNHVHSQLQHSEIAKILANLSELETQLQTTNLERQHADERLKLLNENLILSNRIQDLTQDRHRLVDGEPCPLCGATEHPFAINNPTDTTSQAEQEVAKATAQKDKLYQQYEILNIEKNTQQNKQKAVVERLKELSERSQFLSNQAQILISALPNSQNLSNHINKIQQFFVQKEPAQNNLSQAFDDFLQQIDLYQSDLTEQSALLQTRLNDIEQQQTAYQNAQQALRQLEIDYNKQLSQQNLLQSQQQHYVTQLQEIDHKLTSETQYILELQQRIDGLFLPFITSQNRDTFEPTQAFEQRFMALQQLWQRFQQLNQQLQTLNEQINQHHHTLASLSTEEKNLSDMIEQEQQKQQVIKDKTHKLNQERQQKFGEKVVDDEETLLTHQKNSAFHVWRESEKTHTLAMQQQQKTQENIERLRQNIGILQHEMNQQQNYVDDLFVKYEFIDETHFNAANITDDERESLQHQYNDLTEQQQQNISLLKQASDEVQKLLNNPRTTLSVEQLTTMLEEMKQRSSIEQQELGGVEERLTANQKLKSNQSLLLKQIEEKSKHVKEWKDLHDLIGSSDGKKFRNFAQGLTFNIMISHANEQLKKMSERYLLVADDKEPLMLNVIDIYQDSEKRTSKNLSGGESFIISLALALGLSNMASHRMQVDSLFLDEGFGTLDEEALDMALTTLTNLQQSGKLIGVISHIQALKDRISHQIQVVPQTGGVSKIEGIGVKRLV